MHKGVINLVNYKLCFLRVRDLPFLSIHVFLYICTTGMYFHTPVTQGFPLRAYFTSPHKSMNVQHTLIWYHHPNPNPNLPALNDTVDSTGGTYFCLRRQYLHFDSIPSAYLQSSSIITTALLQNIYSTIILGTAQDVPFALILWYIAKAIYLSQEQYQFAIKSSNLFFDMINLIVRAFYVR